MDIRKEGRKEGQRRLRKEGRTRKDKEGRKRGRGEDLF
jgi:hypothetical protein